MITDDNNDNNDNNNSIRVPIIITRIVIITRRIKITKTDK